MINSRTKANDTLSRFPGPATLHQSVLETALFTFLCAGFAAIIAFTGGGGLWSWILIAIFVGLAVASGRMLRKGQASHMTLDRAGFTLHEPTGYTRFLWRDVSRFEKLEPHRVNSIIVFDDLTREPGARGVGNTSLVENYGLSPLALMDLMNEWRERALIGFSSEVGTGSR
jgi:uncharacterized membrane protein